MSSSPARYFPGLLTKRSGADAHVSSSIRKLAGDTKDAEAETDCRDEDLLLRLQAKDVEALGLLYRRYARLIYSVCDRILKDSTEAEDLVHEIFLCMYRKCRSFVPEKGGARSWIIQLAYSKCFDWRDHLISRRRTAEIDASVSDLALRKNDPDPAYLVVWNGRMLAAFNSLSKKQQQALMLFYFQGLTFQEIADEQGYSYGNAKHHVYRGIQRLKTIVFEEAAPKAISGATHEEKCESQDMAG